MEDFQAVIDAARLGVAPRMVTEIEGVQWWSVPGTGTHGTRIEVIEVHKFGVVPRRKSGKLTAFDAASFNRIIRDNPDAGNVAIYIDRDPENPAVVGVLNGNGPSGPGWGDFRVSMAFRATPQWLKWRAIDNKMKSQADFAEFIEDNLEDIVEPAGAQMLEIVTMLQGTRTTNFRRGINLGTGAVQFQHLEADEVKAGDFEIPQSFGIVIAPFVGIQPFKVPVRFRWRLSDGKLSLGFKLQRIESLMKQVMDEVFAAVVQGDNVAVLEGLPPS